MNIGTKTRTKIQAKRLALRVVILDALDAVGRPVTSRELVELLAARGVVRARGTVAQGLSYLVLSGEVEKEPGCQYSTWRTDE